MVRKLRGYIWQNCNNEKKVSRIAPEIYGHFSEHLGRCYSVAEAFYVTGVMNAHNTFETPEVVTEQVFSSYTKTEDGIRAELPKCSVVCIRLKK